METLSPLAKLVSKPHTNVPPRTRPVPWGVCLHTTGSGVPSKAKVGEDPVDVALRYYLQDDANFAHYVVGYGGDLHQVCDERLRARHAGRSQANRLLYETGDWAQKVSPNGLLLWQTRWNGVKGPLSLHPSASANEDYIGMELIPLLHPLDDGSLFTPEQYAAVREFLLDFERRYSLKLSGSRLVGHEDLDPLERWDSFGGWDPGALRKEPHFFWTSVYGPDAGGTPVA